MASYHQVAAFVAARKEGGMTNAAYSVYDTGELSVTRRVSIRDVSEHRALLVAAWSAVNYCKEHMPAEDLSVYFAERQVPNELTSVWIGNSKAEEHPDSDRIESVLRDCCQIKSVAFGVCPVDGGDYADRMKEIEDSVNG